MSPGAVFFVSDAHLGAEPKEREAARERSLHDFLDHLPGRASALYIVGDLFDFWFEYRTCIPSRHFHTLSALARVRRAGIPITYLGGNHDFWVGRFMREELGIDVRDNPLGLELQGRKIWLHHGDGLVGGDLGYKLLKRVLRNRVCIALYGLLHPDLGIPLAGWVSHLSRGSRDERTLDGPRLAREVAEPRFREGYDAVMIGHFHGVFEHRDAGKDFFVLGDWIRHMSYAVLEAGSLRLERWSTARA
jgi:UDP-2,3-diacylglucosamine hydrolase